MMFEITTSNPAITVPAWVWVTRRATLLEYMLLYASDELFEYFIAMSFEEYECMISQRCCSIPTGDPMAVTASATAVGAADIKLKKA